MSNGIDFLVRMGQDAALRHAAEAEVERALSDTEMPASMRSAIINGDRSRLETLLGARGNVCCLIFAPRKVKEESEEDGERTAA